MDRPLRREDRRLDDAAAMALLKRGEYGILSTSGKDHRPYGIPVNYVVMEDSIFFHCATEGRKLENITANRGVSFCVVGQTELLPEKFSTRYESVVVSGEAGVVEKPELKKKALNALVAKYAPGNMAAGKAYIEKLLEKTAVVRISIDYLIGKTRK
ncbi:pyridoxamine 5'-phosphate oxidase family protein [uncultured Desulfosarcina sp.]|uniref:pyridoxamine 5'-phosphate oxidase family protein n=1 Tax=uncultured Desulfosarcina sp. TaxID=218289 RepID=UPI0029C78046|nr:pyridoxamine 5'-phosphate oxidase family protein [uncultured Desulfosarcina sp.]